MIDFLATVHPDQGLAEVFEARPARPGDVLWQAVVRLTAGAQREQEKQSGADGQGLNPRVVGAYGHSRTDVLARGVGEAVERFALFPERGAPDGAVRGRLSELGERALPFHDPAVALGDPRAAGAEHLWYPARRLGDDSEILVPAALVDYPAPAPHYTHFDPSPSGAASGHGYEMALRSALLETVERDALMVAWQRRLRLARIRIEDVLAISGPGLGPGPGNGVRTGAGVSAAAGAAAARGKRHAARRNLLALWRRARAEGLTPVVADLPTGLPDIHCAVGVVLDEKRTSPLAAVGCNTHEDPWRAMLGALQEALQIRTVVRHLGTEDHGLGEAPGVIVTDDDRLRHVASRAGYEQVSEWVATFTEAPPPQDPAPSALPAARLVERILADGGDPLALDLSFRLPPGLREMGWAAVKVIPVGHQPLRLVERHGFTWHRGRLATAEARTGCVAGPPSTFAHRPHPLP